MPKDAVIFKDPAFWGEHFWFFMECIAFNYSVKPSSEERERARVFFSEYMPHFLPCETCKKHYKQLISKYPVNDKLCCNDCLKKWVQKIKEKIDDIKNNKYVDSVDDTRENKGIHYNKGKSVRISRDISSSDKYGKYKSKNKSKGKSRAKSSKTIKQEFIAPANNIAFQYVPKTKSKYNIKHESGNNKYFKAASINKNVVNKWGNSKAVINNAGMNSRENNINAVKNPNKFNQTKAITVVQNVQRKRKLKY